MKMCGNNDAVDVDFDFSIKSQLKKISKLFFLSVYSTKSFIK